MVQLQRAVVPVLMFVLVAGCGGGDDGGGPTDPPPPTPDFTMSVSPTTVTVVAGGQAAAAAAAVSQKGTTDIQVTVSRSGGFSGTVTVTVSGLPSGVTASALSIDGGQTSGTLTLTAAASASAGSNSLTISGAASGIAAKTASVSLTVEAEPPPSSGSIAVSLATSSVALTQGQQTTVSVTVTRSGTFTGPVTLEGTSDQSGLQASFNPNPVTGDASTLELAVSADQTPGNYTLTVTASGEGVANATASLSVTVNQSSSGGSIQFTFCEQSGIPTWFAFQDGGGAWTQVAPDPPNVFGFDINSATGGFAMVMNDGDDASLQVYYASKQEIETFAMAWCVGSGLSKTVMGSFAGLQAGETGTVTMGGGFASTLTGGTQFTMENVLDGPVDLLASATGVTAGAPPSFFVRKMLIRRNQNPADGSTLSVIDFGSGEAFDPVQFAITVNNGMGHQLGTSVAYVTANGGFSSPFFNNLLGADQFYGVPANQQADGDLHWLTATAIDIQGQTFESSRGVTRFFKTAADQTVTLGPVLSQPTVTVVSTAPYVRPRVELVTQADYNDFWSLGFVSDGGNVSNVLILGGFGVGATLDITLPDFSGVSGWNNDWGIQPGGEVTWSTIGTGWTSEGSPGQPGFEEGNISTNSTRFGTINP